VSAGSRLWKNVDIFGRLVIFVSCKMAKEIGMSYSVKSMCAKGFVSNVSNV